jgi:hypothetical protein
MNPADRENWRLAFIESFREWGISPRGIRSMAEDSLLWPTEKQVIEERVKAEMRAKAAQGFGSADVTSATARGRVAMAKMFQQSAPSAPDVDEIYSQKASRKTHRRFGQPDDILTPAGLSMPRFDLWTPRKTTSG